jgi:hypothetical protein
MDLDALRDDTSHPTAIFGSAGEYREWKVVFDTFMEDRLEPAYEAALRLGTGPTGALVRTYRQIEEETLTRRVSKVRDINAWLQIESVPFEGHEGLDQFILTTIEETASRFGYDERPKLMVTVLTSEVDAPWAPGRFGYFLQKSSFGKICVPQAALRSQEMLRQVLAHEYAHQIAQDLAGGQAPRWLNEAIATASEDRPTRDDRVAFQRGLMPWRGEHELEGAFGAEWNDATGAKVIGQAYAQAAVLGRALADRKGLAGLADLLRGFSNNSTWEDLKMRITGREPVDEALQEVYGIGVKELFSEVPA